MNALVNRLVMLGIVATIVLMWTQAQAAVVYRTVALSDTHAPGTPDSIYFGGIAPPMLNAAGRAAFAALLRRGGDVTSSNDEGLWSEGSGTLTLIAREGSPAPGTPEGVVFGQFLIYPHITDDDGHIVFQAQLQQGGDITVDNFEGIWTDLLGTVTLVARKGSQAPDTPDGMHFGSFFKLALSDAGQLAFYSSAAGVTDGVIRSNVKGIWSGSPGGLTLAARSGEQAPGTPDGTTFKEFLDPAQSYDPVALNNHGRIAFLATLESPDGGITDLNRRGVWSEGSGTLGLVARGGDQAPGTPSGAKFATFHDPVINDAGQTAFLANLARGSGGVTLSNLSGIWSERAGSLSLVAREGDQAPGTPTGTNFGNFLGYNSPGNPSISPVLNASGKIAFRGWLKTGEGGVTTSNDQGIWSEGSGTLALIAREGDAAPGMPEGYKFGAFGNPVMNAAGRVAFAASPYPASIDVEEGYAGIWAEDSTGVLRLIAHTGDVIEVFPGDFRRISYLEFGWYLPSGGEDGRGIVFNDDLTVTFRAFLYSLTTGIKSTAIFTATLTAVPEPATFTLLFSAAMFAPRRRVR